VKLHVPLALIESFAQAAEENGDYARAAWLRAQQQEIQIELERVLNA
jgi:hypothetical protein